MQTTTNITWTYNDHNGLADSWTAELADLVLLVELVGGFAVRELAQARLAHAPGHHAVVEDEAKQAAVRSASKLSEALAC